MRKLLILEVNEVPFEVLDFYASRKPESILAEILNKSAQYITVSTDEGELHPWSTWPTLYRGVDNTSHLIKDLGEDLTERDAKYPPVWKILVGQDTSVGVFSSLHTFPLPENVLKYKYLVPDPFAQGDDTHPNILKSFQAFNLSMSRKSGRTVDSGIDKGKALKLIGFLPILGLRVRTLLSVLNQLVQEKMNPWKVVRRRSFQSILAFDLFRKLLIKHKPQFTTFFTNHVASAMHRYWAATFPEEYEKNELPKEWIRRYQNEIPWCMDQLDLILRDLKKFLLENLEYKLVIASSMGQAATTAELIKHELFLTDFDKFKTVLGIEGIAPLPAMHPQYNFKSENGSSDLVEHRLKSMKINGDPVRYRRKGHEFFSLDLGYPNIEEFEISLERQIYAPEDLGFKLKKIDDQSGGTAYHIPEGSLLIYDPIKDLSGERKKVDLREIAPSILKNYEQKPRDYMFQGTIAEIFS